MTVMNDEPVSWQVPSSISVIFSVDEKKRKKNRKYYRSIKEKKKKENV